LYEAHQQTIDPEYKLPLSTRALATGLTLGISAINSRAAFHIINAGIKPISETLWRQIGYGTTGAGSDGTITNWRLQLRTVLRKMEELAYVGWNHKQWPKYLWETVKVSGKGVAALAVESTSAYAATSASGKAVEMKNNIGKMQEELYRNDANAAPQARAAGG
jgi:hypothetical protein